MTFEDVYKVNPMVLVKKIEDPEEHYMYNRFYTTIRVSGFIDMDGIVWDKTPRQTLIMSEKGFTFLTFRKDFISKDDQYHLMHYPIPFREMISIIMDLENNL